MITRRHIGLPTLAYCLLVAGICGAGVVVGRTFAAGATEQPPRISELRSAPNLYAISARPYQAPADLARSVDAIGVVRVDAIEKVKDVTTASELTGEHSWGRGVVRATVIDAIAGDRAVLESFAFTATFVPNTGEFAISNIDPPLEVGAEYLVFLDGGLVVFPGGNYRVVRGKVWNIGQWEDPESRSYPADLSGLSVSDAARQIRTARAAR
jgi:hypothetical protein